jgi:hypothetical protein
MPLHDAPLRVAHLRRGIRDRLDPGFAWEALVENQPTLFLLRVDPEDPLREVFREAESLAREHQRRLDVTPIAVLRIVSVGEDTLAARPPAGQHLIQVFQVIGFPALVASHSYLAHSAFFSSTVLRACMSLLALVMLL